MTREEFIEIMRGNSDLLSINDDNAFLGLQLIRKYIPKCGIEGAEHDVIYSVDVNQLLDADITKEDVEELRRLNWMVVHGEYMACYV